MKFYGITMQGKFVNQTVASTPPTFDHDTDAGRLIYNEDDGFLWWGDGDDDVWRSIGEGGTEDSDAEDRYSDLLRTSIFLNCTWRDFPYNMSSDLFIDEGASTPILADNWDGNLKAYVFTEAGHELVSNPIMFDDHTELSEVLYCMASHHWVDNHPHINHPIVSVDAGGGWEVVTNNDVHRFASTGIALRIKVVSTGPGTLMSWGLLYNKDLSADCTKHALTQVEFNITGDTTTVVGTQYTPGFVLVYLNGLLLQDGTDYTAEDGENIFFPDPALSDGDVVLVISFGTTAMLDTAEVADTYIRKDALTDWDSGVTQSVNGSKFTNLGDGVANSDSVNIGQLDETDNSYIFNRHSRLYNNAKSLIIVDTSSDVVDVNGVRIVDVGTCTSSTDAANKSYVDGTQSILSDIGTIGGSTIFVSNQDLRTYSNRYSFYSANLMFQAAAGTEVDYIIPFNITAVDGLQCSPSLSPNWASVPSKWGIFVDGSGALTKIHLNSEKPGNNPTFILSMWVRLP